jgi:hypothetical protein
MRGFTELIGQWGKMMGLGFDPAGRLHQTGLLEVAEDCPGHAGGKRESGNVGIGLTMACMVLAAILSPIRGLGQVYTGTITGTVKDTSGGVVPNAKVTLTNNGTGFSLATTTGSSGTYIFTPVKIGIYTVQAEAAGFQVVKRINITVEIQQQAVVNFVLRPGRVTQTVVVTAGAPLLQTEGGSVGQVIGSQQTVDLPLNGRNYTFLAQLSAGVTTGQPEGRGMDAHGTYVANGTLDAQNNYLLDGLDDNSDVVDFLASTQYIVLPPPDAIQEFKLQTADFSAQFGRSAGAVINATTKSGTSTLHGDAWEFVRNDAFDGADFFQNAANEKKAEYRQNQFGFTLGGPLPLPKLKHKSFFFGDYQGTRIREAYLFTGNTVPTVAERASGYTDFSDLITGQTGTLTDLLGRSFPLGTVFDPATTRPVTAGQIDPVTGLTATQTGYVRNPFSGNILPANRLDPNAIRLLNAFPLPNSPGLFGNLTTSQVLNNDTNTFDIRADEDFSDRSTMFTRVSYFESPSSIPPSLNETVGGRGYTPGQGADSARNAVWSGTHSFSPTTIDELSGGFSGTRITRFQNDYNVANVPAQFGIQGVPQYPDNGGLPQINIGGLSGLGAGEFIPAIEYNETTQMTDNLTKVYKSHTFKGGFEFQHIKVATEEPLDPRGLFDYGGTYTSIPNVGDGSTGRAQFVLNPEATTVPGGVNNVGGSNGVQISNTALVDDGQDYEALYFLDDWKATPKLTLNLGVRWEYYSPISENFNAQGNFVPGPPFAGAEYLLPSNKRDIALSPSFTSLLKKDGIALDYTNNDGMAEDQKFNFAPRLGLAFQVTPKFVVRAAYGTFYNAFESLGFLPSLGQSYPFNFGITAFAADSQHPITPNLSIGPLETSLVNMPLKTASVDAEGLLLKSFQYYAKTPYTQSANFTAQYQVTPNQSFQLAYVGTFARHLQVFSGGDLPSVIVPPTDNVLQYVPFPDFAVGSSYATDQGNSFYNSLQATFQRRFSDNFLFIADYTYAKAMNDAKDPLNPGGDNYLYRAPLVPGFGIQGDYALANYDVRNLVHFSGIYELPFGSGKHFLTNARGPLNQVVGGWQMNWILTLRDGYPFSVPCSVDTANEGTSQNILGWVGCYADLTPGQNIIGGKHDVNQWINPLAFHNPPAATAISRTDFAALGGMGLQAVGPGFHRLDFSLFKEFQTTEKTHLEFRAEFFNITNTPQFGLPSFLNLSNAANFGEITSTSDSPNDPRQIQFALKFYW